MKIRYDRETDTLVIILKDARVKESDEVRPGVIADFGYDGGVVRFDVGDHEKTEKSEHLAGGPEPRD